MEYVTLNTGHAMPLIGIGTWKMDDHEAERSVRAALDLGYRLIDTATLYGNERGVGRAVRGSDILREDIFVTTKLWPTDFFSPQQAFDASLERLGLDYVDLYLVHWPIPMMPKSVWFAMEKLFASKRARSIGVSNYGIGDLERLLAYATVVPAVNQVRFSPFDYAEEALKSCASRGIALQAYSPLTRGSRLHDTAVTEIADRHGKTPAQVLLRWCIEHGVSAIPKSSDSARMRENIDIFGFELSPEEVATLDALDERLVPGRLSIARKRD